MKQALSWCALMVDLMCAVAGGKETCSCGSIDCEEEQKTVSPSVTSFAQLSLVWFLLISFVCSFPPGIVIGQADASPSMSLVKPLMKQLKLSRRKSKGAGTTKLTRKKAVRKKATALSVRLDMAGRDFVLLNSGYEEDNRSYTGDSIQDHYPDYRAGDRIDPTDSELLKASLHLHGVGSGQWKLLFPTNIKVWRPVPGKSKQYQQVLSGVSTTALTLPQSIPLFIEGISKTSKPPAFKVVAVVTSSKSKKSVTDAVLLTVVSGGFVLD